MLALRYTAQLWSGRPGAGMITATVARRDASRDALHTGNVFRWSLGGPNRPVSESSAADRVAVEMDQWNLAIQRLTSKSAAASRRTTHYFALQMQSMSYRQVYGRPR